MDIQVDLRRKVQETSDVMDKICTDWECDFLNDMMKRQSHLPYSDKQAAIINKLYEKACNSPY